MNNPHKLYIDEQFIRAFLKKHGVVFTEKKRNRKTVLALDHCPFNENHVNGEAAIIIDERGSVRFDCKHDSCKGKTIIDFILYYEPNFYHDEKITQKARENTKDKEYEINAIPGVDLMSMHIELMQDSIVDICPGGLTVFSADFKFGKSFFVLQACLAVAAGKPLLEYATTQGEAIYIDLEDDISNAQARLKLCLQGEACPEDFYLILCQENKNGESEPPLLGEGFEEYLDQLIAAHPRTRLIVIDTLACIVPERTSKDSPYATDYRIGRILHGWADSKGISLIVVTHNTKKKNENDVFMNMQGTVGLASAADALWTITKESRITKRGLFSATGRRIKEQFFRVSLDSNGIWHHEGVVDEYSMQEESADAEKRKLLEIYQQSPIREAVIRLANECDLSDPLPASGLKDAARSLLSIYLTDSNKDIGGFLTRYQNHFMVYDGITVEIIKNGTGSSRYRLTGLPHEELPFNAECPDESTE